MKENRGMRAETARPGKRPLRALSAAEKMEAIQRVHDGESKASVARDIGVPESTLRGWCKSEHKIRGMARNSSTPDSEAHSPASSSGALVTASQNAGANHSSEDECPVQKRIKSDHSHDSSDMVSKLDTKNLDYLGLMSMATAGMRSESSALLLQHLGMMTAGAKNYMSMSGLANSGAVGLVENGLQYTKGAIAHNLSNKRHSSAIAPTQLETMVKSVSRKSHLAAAEAPTTQVPINPNAQMSNVHLSGQLSNQLTSQLSSQLSNQLSSQMSNQLSSQMSNQLSGQMSNQLSGQMSNQLSSQMSNQLSSQMSNQLSGQMSNQLSSQISNQISSQLTSQMSSQMANQLSNQMSNQLSNPLTNQLMNQLSNPMTNQASGAHGNKKNGNNQKIDDALWTWLTHQQQMIGQQAATFNQSMSQDGSWFWQWYKQIGIPLGTSAVANNPTNLAQTAASNALTNSTTNATTNASPTNLSTVNSASNNASPTNLSTANSASNASPITAALSNSKRSSSKARAVLDNVLCNNNNDENINVCANVDEEMDGDVPHTTQEAIEHADKFFSWLNKCSDPSVTRMQIIQFKMMLDKLKENTKKRNSPNLKQSRK